jgi:3-hydroxyisobutyrate dehydrogenase-like beta-hydroxyacid dehydrogenase
MDHESIGFVGVGLMGHGMAKNIVEKGYRLTVTAHRNRAPVDDLVKRGASEAASAREVAAHSEIIFLCLTGSPQVEAVIAEMAPSLREGSVVVDCSTSDPVSTARIAETLSRQGVDFADAPLSRTPREAWEGTLDTMIGADERVFERIRPVVATWAGKIVHIGGVGDGHRMKLLNNFLSLGYAAIYSEALTMAAKVGIPVERFDSVIRGGRMDCGFYQTFMAYTLEGNREAHRFTISNAYKDLKYVESMANNAGVATMLSTAAKNAFAIAMANGGSGPENYIPHLPDYIAAINGIRKEKG